MERSVEVQNTVAGMFDNKEAIQRAEVKVRNGEEVERSNHFTMVVQKSAPLAGFAFVRNALQPLEIARHGGFGDVETEQQQLPMDARRPQLGFSLFRRRIKRRTSSDTFGRPIW